MTTNPTHADVERLIAEAEALSAMINMGEKIAWGRDTAMIDALIAALRAMQAERREMALDVLAASGQAQEAYEAQLAAEAKLAEVEGERDDANKKLRQHLSIFADHAAVVMGIIRAAGELPKIEDGPFKDGFLAGMEEVAARGDIQAGDGGDQLQTLCEQIVALVTGEAALVVDAPSNVIDKLNRLVAAEAHIATLTAQVEAMRGALEKLGQEPQEGELMVPFIRRNVAIARAALTTENQTNG